MDWNPQPLDPADVTVHRRGKGAPLVLPVPCWVWMENPVLVTLMHCWAEVPQRLFITT